MNVQGATPEPSSRSLNGSEASDITFTGDSIDEKGNWNSATPTSLVNTIYRDQIHPVRTSDLPDSNQPPTSPIVYSSPLRESQFDARRASRRSYMEDYPHYDPDRQEDLYDDEEDEDDDIRTGSASRNKLKICGCYLFSTRGILNMGAVILLAAALVTVFGVLPIIYFVHSRGETQKLIANSGGLNLGGINATGQVPIQQSFASVKGPSITQNAVTQAR